MCHRWRKHPGPNHLFEDLGRTTAPQRPGLPAESVFAYARHPNKPPPLLTEKRTTKDTRAAVVKSRAFHLRAKFSCRAPNSRNGAAMRFRLIALLVVLTSLSALAQPPQPAADSSKPPSVFGNMRWRLIGPFRGGRALAVEGVAGDPLTYYFGAAAGGVWRTGDGGLNWTPVFDKQDIASIGAIAVAPSQRSTIYV